MGATVNYNNTNPEQGVYGAYNDFVALISSSTTLPKNLTYEITVTAVNDGTVLASSSNRINSYS